MHDHYHSRQELYDLNNKIIQDAYDHFYTSFKILSPEQRLALHRLAGTCRKRINGMDEIRITSSENIGRIGIPTLVKYFLLAILKSSKKEFKSYEPFRIYYLDFLKNRFNYELKKDLFPDFKFYDLDDAAYFPAVPVTPQEDTSWARSLKQTLKRGLSAEILEPYKT